MGKEAKEKINISKSVHFSKLIIANTNQNQNDNYKI